MFESDESGDTITDACTVMPDHLHWLFRLGGRLTLGRVVARFKANTKMSLAGGGLAWQRDFFEHRLRAEESVEDYGRYIFLNAYRAALLRPGDSWAGWWCPRPETFEFTGLLGANGSPPTEWLGEESPGLSVGE